MPFTATSRAVLFSLAYAGSVSAAWGLTLPEAAALLSSQNPQLLSAKASVELARENKSQAAGAFLPTLSAEAQLAHQKTQIEGGAETNSDPKTYSLSASQSLFAGGGNVAAFRAARTRVDAAEANFETTTQNLILQLAQSYTQVLTAQEEVGLNGNQVELLQKQYHAAQRQFELGEMTATEVQQAQASLAQARASLINARQALVAAQEALRALIGTAPAELQWPVLNIPPLPPLDDVVAKTQALHPQIQTALAQLTAAGYDVREAQAAHLPTVTATASVSKNEDAYNVLGDIDTTVQSVMLNVSVPLFQGGRIFSAVRSSKLSRMQAQQNYIAARRAVEQELKDAYFGLDAAQNALLAYEESLKAAQLATEGIVREEDLGERDLLDVLDAFQQRLVAEVNVSRARQNVVVAWYRYLAATGALNLQTLETAPAVEPAALPDSEPAEELAPQNIPQITPEDAPAPAVPEENFPAPNLTLVENKA